MINQYFEMTEKCLPYCDTVYEGYDMPYAEYVDVIEKSEAELCCLPAFLSRRMLEAAMSKTLIVLWIPPGFLMSGFGDL